MSEKFRDAIRAAAEMTQEERDILFGRKMTYREKIRALPCLTCGRRPSEAAHIKFSDARVGKKNMLGKKQDDRWCVPLCADCHRGPKGQHSRGERKWWESKGIDPIAVAEELWACEGRYEKMLEIATRVYFYS